MVVPLDLGSGRRSVAGLGEPVDGGGECVDVGGGGGDVVGSVVAAAVVDVRLHEARHMPQLVGVGPPAHRWLRASARAAAMATTISARARTAGMVRRMASAVIGGPQRQQSEPSA